MDLSEYWQENRGFVLTVAAGAVVFLIGLKVVDASYGADLKSMRANESRLKRELTELTYTGADRDRAQSVHERLLTAVDELRAAALFTPRPEFILGEDSPSAHFHRVVGRVRDDLLPAASRARVRLDKTLGLPKLSPTKEGEIERTLEALDAIERVVRIAIEERVERIEDIRIRLDPSRLKAGRAGADAANNVERTRVEFKIIGSGERLAVLLARTQREAAAGALMLDTFEMDPSRARVDETELELTLGLARLIEGTVDAEEEN